MIIEPLVLNNESFTLLLTDDNATYLDVDDNVLGYVVACYVTDDREIQAWNSSQGIYARLTMEHEDYHHIEPEDMATFFLELLLDLHRDAGNAAMIDDMAAGQPLHSHTY